MYTNANSLQNKMSEMQVKISDVQPDEIGVTEVWMKDFVMQGYHPAIRHDRKGDQKGGWVMLLVHRSLCVVECTYLNEFGYDESV